MTKPARRRSSTYQALCAEFYELDKPFAAEDVLQLFIEYAEEANGPILAPMCGTGRYLIPLLEKGYSVTGFDSSPFMLEICRRKCEERGLKSSLFEGTFENFDSEELYKLILIPSCSFCLLTDPNDIAKALTLIAKRLHPEGKFVFDIETIHAVSKLQGVWKGRWRYKPDGSKIVLNTCSQYDVVSRIETVLCRYELWENNVISRTEVEDFRLRLYKMSEIQQLLEKFGFQEVHKWQGEPYRKVKAHHDHEVVLFECTQLSK